jgi:hypothetical protein
MDWESIKHQWQGAKPIGELPELPRDDETKRLWATVRRRDWLESAVAAVLVPIFGFLALRALWNEQWLTAFFAAMLVVAVVYIPFRLWRTRRLIPQPDPQQPVHTFLTMERRALTAQIDMLNSVSRWYSGPICIGAVGIFGSVRGPGLALFGYAVVVALLFIVIEWANRIAVRKKFAPAIAAIEQQLSALEE